MKNSNGGDINVGSISIEEAVRTMEHWVEYEKANKDKINKADELILIQETILADYKRLKEDFKDIDHECSRLEDIDIRKDLKIIKLEKENYSLKCQYDKALEDLVKEFKVKQELKDKLKELKVKWEEMRPYRDISPHDFGYISGQIDMLAEILSNKI